MPAPGFRPLDPMLYEGQAAQAIAKQLLEMRSYLDQQLAGIVLGPGTGLVQLAEDGTLTVGDRTLQLTRVADVPGAVQTAVQSALPAEVASAVAAALANVPAAAPASLRQASLQPGSVDSLWNIGVGLTADFERATDPLTAAVLNPSVGSWINRESSSTPINQATAADPLATVTDVAHGGTQHRIRIPAAAVISAGSDASMVVIDPAGRYGYEMQGTVRLSSTAYNCVRFVTVDLGGSGMGPNGGTRASGSSTIFGLIRKWEIEAGRIDHAIGIALASSQLLVTPGGTVGYDAYGRRTGPLGYVSPATDQDADSASTYTGVVPMGTVLGIPLDVNVETVPGLNAAARMVARAMQRRGGIVIDRSSLFTIVAEPSAPAAWVNSLRDAGQLGKVRSLLRVIRNHSDETPLGAPWVGDASNRAAPLVAPLAPFGKVA